MSPTTPSQPTHLTGTPDPTSPSQSQTLLLPSGRTLGFAEYGTPTGTPAIFMHGLPGTRLDASEWHTTALTHNVRLICPDRPGFGLSTYQPHRTLLDLPGDIQCLARHLGLESYYIFGQSGGGPYALACAYALPREEVKGVCVVAGAAPMEVGTKGMRFAQRVFWWLLMYAPWLARVVMWVSRVERMVKMDDEELGKVFRKGLESARPKDRAVLDKPEVMTGWFATVREGFRQGYEGFLRDGKIFVEDWGFDLRRVEGRDRVKLFYGMEDENVPVAHGRWIAERIPGAELVVFEGETHFTIAETRYNEIMERALRHDACLLA